MGMMIDSTMTFFQVMFANCVVHIGFYATVTLFATPVALILAYAVYKLYKLLKRKKE